MRTFVLFALGLAGTAIVADDADAGIFGRKKRGGNNCCPQPVAASPCCGGASGYGGYGPGMYGSRIGYAGPYFDGTTYMVPGTDGQFVPSTAGAPGATVNGKASVIQATDGSVYQLGADGSYYPASAGVQTMGGFTTQPYYGSGYYNGRGYSSYYPSGVNPAGYRGGYYPNGYYPGSVYPAGGTGPLTMPGINLPGGITIVPTPMPNK